MYRPDGLCGISPHNLSAEPPLPRISSTLPRTAAPPITLIIMRIICSISMALSSVICHCKERIKSRSWRACRIHSGDSQASDTFQPLQKAQRTGLSITITPAITFFMLKTPQLAAENFKSAGGSRFRYTQRADAEPLCQYEYFRQSMRFFFPVRLQRCDQPAGILSRISSSNGILSTLKQPRRQSVMRNPSLSATAPTAILDTPAS